MTPAEEFVRRRTVKIDYTNWEGERATRLILPMALRFGTNIWHPVPQWLLEAFDLARNEERTFALKDIHGWKMEATP
jgi:predicted DNA-binding transcriptional regulator YafY